ncbi:ROK family transcriptional regulator [Marinimicrobium alkaliphilum]|uniref:ROK family transcriptional regulator n=1 Tax=Marinimicrobium alkaliphilum TaxID=2202654 RepID=UPI000DBA5D0A|nr:ROK family transcriptional regulator [Marinimicrobium alkaliphilum]
MSQGSNASGLRRYNERVILTFLRKYRVASKSDLARATNLTPQAVTRIVDDLESAELVIREGRRLGGLGQPSILYTLNPAGAYSIGIKVGRRDLELILMDFTGKTLQSFTRQFEEPDPDYILGQIEILVPELQEPLSKSARSRIRGVGVAMPWFMGVWPSGLEMGQDLSGKWQRLNMSEEVARRVELPVYFENDGAAAAVAELQLGVGKDISDFLYVNIGAFIGGGLVLQGNLEPGVHGNAAELASMPVPHSRLKSITPPEGYFELLTRRASLLSLRKHLNSCGIEISHIGELPNYIDAARVQIQEWMDDCADALVHAFLSVISILDLKAIVIDASLPRFIVEELVAIVERRIKKLASKDIFIPEILVGDLGYQAVVVGGGILPFYSSFGADKTVLLKGSVPDRITR